MASEEEKVRFPDGMEEATTVKSNDRLMMSDGDTNRTKTIDFDKVKEYLEITDIELYPVQGRATEAEATPLPSGPAGQNRKMDASPGWYSVGGVPVEAESGKVWKWFWNGSEWSLVDMGELPEADIDKTNTISERTERVTTEEAVLDYAPSKEQVGIFTYSSGTNLVYELRHSDINDDEIWENGIWSKNGGFPQSSTLHRRTKNRYPINEGVSVDYQFRLTGNAGVCFYDRNGVFISAIWNENEVSSGIVEGHMVTPEDARSYAVSHNINSSLSNNIHMTVIEDVTVATNDVFARTEDLPETGGEIQEGDNRLVDGDTIARENYINQSEVLQELTESENPVSATAVIEYMEDNQQNGGMFTLNGGRRQIIDVSRFSQIDLVLDTLGVPFTFGGVFRIRGLKRGLEKSLYFIETNKKYAHSSAMPLQSDVSETYKIFLNVEDIDLLELFFDTTYTGEKLRVVPTLHAQPLEGREFDFTYMTEGESYINLIAAARAKLMHGYRYYQISDDISVGANTCFREQPNVRGTDYEDLTYNLLTRAGETVVPDSIANWGNNVGLSGKDQGYVYEPSQAAGMFISNPSRYMGSGAFTVNRTRVICRNTLDKKEVRRSYKDFDLIGIKSTTVQKDAFNGSVIEWRDRAIDFYVNGYWGIKNTLNLNSVLDVGDRITNAYLIPFQKTLENSTEGTALRIWIYTERGKCYYNYATESSIYFNTVNTWAESELINQFQQYIPVNDVTKASNYKKYFPVLLDFDYGQTNDAPEPGSIYERPFIKTRQNWSPFRVLTKNSIARLDHLTAFGNYNVEVGQEPFVMLTSNGGKTWYVKAYFASTDQYTGSGTRGGGVNFAPISANTPYVENSLNMRRRRYNHPSAENMEPSTRFILNPLETAPVKSFTFDSTAGTMRVELSEDAPWIEGSQYNVVYFENVSADNDWNPICNTGLTPNAATTTHIFFRVRRINAREFHLYADMGNPYEGNLVCRHVHSVNATPSGFMITTGESKTTTADGVRREGGDFFYIADNVRNHSTARGAQTGRTVYRLTSKDTSIFRGCGAYLTQNGDVIFASDQGFSTDETFTVEGRSIAIPKTPVGIYRGKLTDVDDASKFECIKELEYTALSLLTNEGRFAVDYKHGHTVVSPDGITWYTLRNIRQYVTGLDNNGDFYLGADTKLEWK